MIFVMAMNSQGNQPPQHPTNSESISRRFDEQRLTPNIDVTINPTDVLCGRGKSSFTHVGNRRFREAINGAIDEYNSSESRLAKSRVVQRIVENIKGNGGRFLKRDRASGGWVELDPKTCRDKVGHAIRDASNLNEAKRQKQQRRKEAFAAIGLDHRKGKSSSSPTTQVLGGSSSSTSQRRSPSSAFRGESWLPINTSLREESKLSSSPWRAGYQEESKLSRREDDDDIFYEPASESKLGYFEDDYDDYPSEDDSFVKYINDILGPINAREVSYDPLVDYSTDDDFYSSSPRRR